VADVLARPGARHGGAGGGAIVAAVVARGEALGVPLVTCDARLARAAGRQAAIELFERV
jgi:hypothetical protein